LYKKFSQTKSYIQFKSAACCSHTCSSSGWPQDKQLCLE